MSIPARRIVRCYQRGIITLGEAAVLLVELAAETPVAEFAEELPSSLLAEMATIAASGLARLGGIAIAGVREEEMVARIDRLETGIAAWRRWFTERSG